MQKKNPTQTIINYNIVEQTLTNVQHFLASANIISLENCWLVVLACQIR